MPRAGVTSDFLAALESTYLRPAFFVEAHFVSGPVYLWSGLGSLTWNSHTWLGIGTMGSISTIEEGADIQARNVTLTMSGIDSTLLGDVLTEFQVGLPVIVWLGLFDGSNALISDPVSCFAGRMDQPVLDVSGETATISINCENRLVEMNVSVERRYTNEDQQLDHPGDRGFEFVPSIQQITIYWGRSPNSTNNL